MRRSVASHAADAPPSGYSSPGGYGSGGGVGYSSASDGGGGRGDGGASGACWKGTDVVRATYSLILSKEAAKLTDAHTSHAPELQRYIRDQQAVVAHSS